MKTLLAAATFAACIAPASMAADVASAYLGYHDALVKRDAKALQPLLSKESREQMAQAEKDKKAAAYMKYLAEEHPGRSVQVAKGWSNGKVALLLITGESAAVRSRAKSCCATRRAAGASKTS